MIGVSFDFTRRRKRGVFFMYPPQEDSCQRFITRFQFSTCPTAACPGPHAMSNRIEKTLKKEFREIAAYCRIMCGFMLKKADMCQLKWSVMYQGLRYTAVAT